MAPFSQFAAATLLAMSPVVAALNSLTYVGCFKSSTGLSMVETYQYQSDGHCQEVCVDQNGNAPVLGLTGGDDCYCGSVTPPTSDMVSNSSCNTPCQGFGQHMCGGTGFYSVYLTGTEANVASSGGSSSATTTTGASSGTTTTASSPSVITSVAPGRTIVVTQSAQASSETASSSSSPSSAAKSGSSHTAAIVGAVVGVVGALVLIGAIFFLVRRSRKRNAEINREKQAGDFLAGGKRPTIPAVGRRSPLESESRFDSEAMAHRRLSDGSIADNEDYSRRILKVTNPEEGH